MSIRQNSPIRSTDLSIVIVSKFLNIILCDLKCTSLPGMAQTVHSSSEGRTEALTKLLPAIRESGQNDMKLYSRHCSCAQGFKYQDRALSWLREFARAPPN